MKDHVELEKTFTALGNHAFASITYYNKANVENNAVLDVTNSITNANLMNATTSNSDAVTNLVKAWEGKNARRVAKGAGLSTMAITLAACGGGGGSTTATTPVTPPTAPAFVAPNALAFTVTENITAVGSKAATDVNGDTVTYTLSGTDADKFTVDANGNIAFNSAKDFESDQLTYNVTITASDGTLSSSQNLLITLGDDSTEIHDLYLTVDGDQLFGNDGENDIFYGSVNADTPGVGSDTFSSSDDLDGRGGTDTLRLTFEANGSASAVFPSASLTSIEVIDVRNVSGDTLTIDLRPIAGEATLVSRLSTHKVVFSGVEDDDNVIIIGNTQITNGDIELDFDNDYEFLAEIELQGGVTAGVLTVGTSDDVQNVDLTSAAGASNVLTTLALDNQTDDLNLDVFSNLTISTISGFESGADIDIDGDSYLLVVNALPNAVDNVDGRGSSGGFNLILGSGNTTVYGTSSNDILDVEETGNNSVFMGDGNDTVYARANLTDDDTIDGGSGSNTLYVAAADFAGLTAAGEGLSNFATLHVTSYGGVGTSDLLEISTILPDVTSIILTGAETANDGGDLEVSSGTSIKLDQAGATSNATISVKGTGTSDNVILTDASTSSNAYGKLTFAGIETVTYNGYSNLVGSSETIANVVATADAAFTLNIGGTGNNAYRGGMKVTDVTVNGAGTNDTVTAAGLNWTFAGSPPLGFIMGQAYTGVDTIIGSSYNDTLYGDDKSGVNSTINAGAGDDTIYLGNIDTFTGGSGTDTYIAIASAGTALTDTITDYGLGAVSGEPIDVIDLTGIAADADGQGNGATSKVLSTLVGSVTSGSLNLDLLGSTDGANIKLDGYNGEVKFKIDNDNNPYGSSITNAYFSMVDGATINGRLDGSNAAINEVLIGGDNAQTLVADKADQLIGGGGNDTFDIQIGRLSNTTTTIHDYGYTAANNADIIKVSSVGSSVSGGTTTVFNATSLAFADDTNSGTDISLVSGDGDTGVINLAGTTGAFKLDVTGVASAADYGINYTTMLVNIDSGGTLVGTSTAEILLGGAGVQTITGGVGDDYIDGKAGADVFIYTAGNHFGTNERLFGGADSDELRFTSTTNGDTLTIGHINGVETIKAIAANGSTATSANVNINVTATSTGNLAIYGNSGNNVITASDGDDTLHLGGGADTWDGGTGTDTLTAAASATANVDGSGATSVGVVINDTDVLINESAIKTLMGGTIGISSALTEVGSDSVAYLYANDTTVGSSNVTTFSNIENFTGSGGTDLILGGSGNNVINGGGGNDYIDAGAGNDTITGGAGNDTLIGGAGSDTFHFDSGIDTVKDFVQGAGGDVIDISSTGNSAFTGTGASSLVVSGAPATAAPAAAVASGVSSAAVADGAVLTATHATYTSFDTATEILNLFDTTDGATFEDVASGEEHTLLIAFTDTGKTHVWDIDHDGTTITATQVAVLESFPAADLTLLTAANFAV